MRKRISQLYKFLQTCIQSIKTSRIALYSSKFSKKNYTQHQHLAILLLKKKQKRKYRKKLKNSFPRKQYNQRSKAESVFSVIKRKFGETLYSRKINNKKKEIRLKNITYNIYRFVKIGNNFYISVIMINLSLI